ncbi:MAG: relaxase/mobilization nuclease domain-containing protein, partial [Edaphobacter sp.]
GGGKGMPQVAAHLSYISRNGQVELENENGEVVAGREALRDLRDEWQYGQYGIPEMGRYKQAFNIVLSMPPGTDRAAVKSAARDFATRQFGGNHPYVFAEHADEAHPHVHLCVKAMGDDGTRLNPRKADLQQWREDFAQSLREQGVAANATRRVARGVVRKGVRQEVLQMERRGQKTIAMEGQRRAVAEELRGERALPNPLKRVIDKSRKQVISAYGEAARLLASSPEAGDRRLALEVVEFVRGMPSPLSAREVAVNRKHDERLRQEKNAPKGRESKSRDIGVKPKERER